MSLWDQIQYGRVAVRQLQNGACVEMFKGSDGQIYCRVIGTPEYTKGGDGQLRPTTTAPVAWSW